MLPADEALPIPGPLLPVWLELLTWPFMYSNGAFEEIQPLFEKESLFHLMTWCLFPPLTHENVCFIFVSSSVNKERGKMRMHVS